MNSPKKWTPAEIETAQRMRSEGCFYGEIDAALGRPKGSSCGKLYRDNEPEEGKARRRLRLKRVRAEDYTQRQSCGVELGSKASEAMLAARDLRSEAAGRRDLSAALLGDPPPGFSALDRKLSGAS
jgi:hypothetical protein